MPTQNDNLIRKVYDLAKPYGRKKLAFVFAVILVQGVFQVVGVASIFPFLALAADPGQLRDSSIGTRVIAWLPEMSDRTLLIWAGALAVLMLVLSSGLLILGQVVRVGYAEGLGHWLRCRLLSRMVSNPYSYFLKRNTGEMLKKAAGDVNKMVATVLLPALDGFSRLLTSILLLATLFIIDPVIATVAALALGGFYVIVFFTLRSRLADLSDRMKIANRGAIREAQQLLGAIKPVKIHCSENAMLERYRHHSAEKTSLQKWMPIYKETPRYLIEPLAFGGIVVLVVALAAKGQELLTLLPTLGLMALAGYRLLPNLQLLYSVMASISMGKHTVEEVHEEFIDAATAEHDEKIQQTPAAQLQWADAIRIENLTFQYPGSEKPLFQNLSLEIKKNQFVAFVGPTGCGKSTLVDLLLGLHTPTSGQILIDHIPLEPKAIPGWRGGVGYVPQDIVLLDDSIAANIAFGVPPKEIDMDRVAEVARMAQIAEFIETELAQGYQTHVGERGVRLSGGQIQRIGLARSLYHHPSTLILDEATSALDNATETALMKAVEGLHGEVTLIVIAHRLSTIDRADWICDLQNGGILKT